ncbi:MAG: hypothetical protein WCF90_08555 [Methanomicrobiales archaeon]
MHDSGCPPFLEVLSYLVAIILSCALIGYILLWLSASNLTNVTVSALIALVVFAFLTLCLLFRLARELFPTRLKRCKASSLVREMMEIDAVIQHGQRKN